MKSNKGFTILELLVVIAIIGILAAVILGALSSSRTKGKDSRVQQELAQLRNQFNIEYNGSIYAVSCGASVTFCSLTTNVNGALSAGSWGSGTGYVLVSKDIYAQNTVGLQITMTSNSTVGASPATGYALYARTASSIGGTAVYYCIDSSGATKTNSTGPGTVTLASAATCQ